MTEQHRQSPATVTSAAEQKYELAVPILAQTDQEVPIYLIREQKVLLEQDVARLYEVETSALIRAVSRHLELFPTDFMFRLSSEEYKTLATQLPASYNEVRRNKSTPMAFTEAGVAMVSQILNSARALQVNVAIMRDFVRLRKLCGSSVQMLEKLEAIDSKYDQQMKKIMGALEQLQGNVKPPQDRRIGFYAS